MKGLERPRATKDEPTVSEAVPFKIRTTEDLEKIISPQQLKLFSAASGGFTYGVDSSLPPERLGYTRFDTKRIFINPLHASTMPEKPLKGFFLHESGHHAPEVIALQDAIARHIKRDLVVPQSYAKTPELKKEFYGAVYSHLWNVLADVWLESFLGRKPFFEVRNAIDSVYEHPVSSFKNLPKPEQLGQYLVGEARHPSGHSPEEVFDKDVVDSWKRIEKSGAMDTLQRTQAFENPFASPHDREMAIERKFNSYVQVFLPEWLKLLESEVNERANQERSNPQQQERIRKMIEEFLEQEAKRSEERSKQQGENQDAKQESDADKYSRAEKDALEKLRREVAKNVLEELVKEGKKRESLAPSEEDETREKEFNDAIERIIEADKKRESSEDDGAGSQKTEPSQPKGFDAISRGMDNAQAKREEAANKGLAEALGVGAEDVRRWNEIRENRRDVIEKIATQLSEIFLEDRRQRIEYLKREGYIVPGLEFETVAAVASGDADPETRMRSVKNPEFMETEIEFIVDKSGSMGGEKMRKTVELLVVLIEGMKRVKETLADENLLQDGEDPLRIGVVAYDTEPHRVTPLEDPVDDKKEVKIVSALSSTGGGTRETQAIGSTYGNLRLHSPFILKMIILETDGHGDKNGVAPIMEQIAQDDEVVFLAIGLGETDGDANAIVQSYLEPVKDRESNVFAIAKTDMETLLPDVLDFLKREVEKKRNQLH